MQEAHDSEEFCPEAQVNYYPAEKLEFRDVPACDSHVWVSEITVSGHKCIVSSDKLWCMADEEM